MLNPRTGPQHVLERHARHVPAVMAPARRMLSNRHEAGKCRSKAPQGPTPGLDMLRASRPIDRLRYQARLIFDQFDSDGDGRLSLTELSNYYQHCDAQLLGGGNEAGPSQGLGSQGQGSQGQGSQQQQGSAAQGTAQGLPQGLVSRLQQQQAELTQRVSTRPLPERAAGFEEFVDLVRAQVAAVSSQGDWIKAQLPPAQLQKQMFTAGLTPPEFAAVMCIFKLLDRDRDGRLGVEELRRAQGIEKQIFDNVLEDADSDEDGYLAFEDFLTSYAKERPVFMSMAVMAAHTACFWAIFQLPIDTMLKVLLSALLVMRPQIVTAPVKHIWAIGKTIWNRIRATQEMASKGASWSSLA